jgi:hypothetical protein
MSWMASVHRNTLPAPCGYTAYEMAHDSLWLASTRTVKLKIYFRSQIEDPEVV